MSDSTNGAISVKDPSIGYGANIILQNVSFQVRRGEVFVILGASGSGKSTLLKAIIGLYSPLAGDAWIEGASTRGDIPIYAIAKSALLQSGEHGAHFAGASVLTLPSKSSQGEPQARCARWRQWLRCPSGRSTDY